MTVLHSGWRFKSILCTDVLGFLFPKTMNNRKLHHYVPQFYLRRFVDDSGRLWVWDRDNDRTFAVKPDNVAAEHSFYLSDELAELGEDALAMEKQFSEIEGEVAQITSQWLDWLRENEPRRTDSDPVRESRIALSPYLFAISPHG